MVQWEARYNLGLEEIDAQHKWLFEIINKIWEAIVDRAGREQILALIEELEDYTLDHFSAEESLMLETGYPEFDTHRLAHKHFAARIAEEKQRARHSGQITLDLVHFLKNWLVEHIQHTDRQYAAFTRSQKQESLLTRFFKRFV